MSRADRRRWPIGVDPRRQRRREDAVARQAIREARTTDEQLALCRSRRGNSKKEIRKLMVPDGS